MSDSSHYATSPTKKRKQVLTERKQKLISPSRFPKSLPKFSAIPDQIAMTEKFTYQYLLKNNSTLQLTSTNQIRLPYLIIMIKDNVLVKKLSSAICALANQEEGGFILIAAKSDSSMIQQGLQNFSQNQEDEIHHLVQDALNQITSGQNIQTKIQKIGLYPNFDSVFTGQKSEEFMIKISVSRRPQSNKIFYFEHKLNDSKMIYEFIGISKKKQESQEVYFVENITGTAIYDLMCKTIGFKLRHKKAVTKVSVMDSKSSLNLQVQVHAITTDKQIYNKLFRFAEDPNKLLICILQGLQIFYRNQISQIKSFEKSEGSTTAIQLQVNINQNMFSLKNIQQFLLKLDIEYRIPLLGFQDHLGKFRKEKADIASYVCYFFVKGSYSDFSNSTLKSRISAEFQEQFVLNEVKCRIRLGVPLDGYELEFSRSFFWYYFGVSEIKENQKQSKGMAKFKTTEFRFDKSDFGARIIAFFYLALAKKKPY